MQNAKEMHLKYEPEVTWPKDFPELKLIDNELRCGICYDYIKTCMVTPCAHSYCSICIRRSLLYKSACPTCFEETFDTNLRNNRIIDRVIELFTSIKEKLIKHLKISAVQFNCSEQVLSPVSSHVIPKYNTQDATPKRNGQKPLKSSSAKGKLQFISKSQSNISKSSGRSDISKRLEDILFSPPMKVLSQSEVKQIEPSLVNDNTRVPSVPSIFLHQKVGGQPKLLEEAVVPCPVCNVNIPERNINLHLDSCLSNADKPPVKKSPDKIKQKRNPLRKLVWSIMAEKDLRKKLKEYGLNTHGDKKILISRLQRYVLLYNSECDSDNPRPVSELIRQLEIEEKQLSAPSQQFQRLFMTRNCNKKGGEEENKKYVEENKNSFKKLIEAMKEREGRNIKPVTYSSHRLLSDDEDDAINTNQFRESERSKLSEIPSTSKCTVKSIDLCDSNGSDGNYSPTSSPVLGASNFANKAECNGNDSVSSMSDTNCSKINEDQRRNLNELCSMLNSSDAEISNDNLSISSSKRSRTPSPSCIISGYNSESENSFSLLTHQNSDEAFLHNSSELLSECLRNKNSQLEDHDLVLDTEHTGTNSDEVFIPQRRSKRKFQNSVFTDNKQNPSPRQTRRRFSK